MLTALFFQLRGFTFKLFFIGLFFNSNAFFLTFQREKCIGFSFVLYKYGKGVYINNIIIYFFQLFNSLILSLSSVFLFFIRLS